MLLTRGLTSDFDSVCALYARVTSAMHEKGIAQWNWGTYPNAEEYRRRDALRRARREHRRRRRHPRFDL